VGRGKAETLDGEWNTKNLLIAEFPDIEKARAWFDSKEYASSARHQAEGGNRAGHDRSGRLEG